VVHVQHTPARLARHLTPSLPLADSTRAALAARGIKQLFVHQAAAVDALCCQRKHVVVATSTASGKSLCYNVSMLEALARDRDVSRMNPSVKMFGLGSILLEGTVQACPVAVLLRLLLVLCAVCLDQSGCAVLLFMCERQLLSLARHCVYAAGAWSVHSHHQGAACFECAVP
jgi:ATP-dependent helicase YprA (DUF1998 family)